MVCIHCGQETHVTNSRLQRRSNQVWRRRHCGGCGAVFTTEETADYASAWAVQTKTGTYQPFSRDKLLISLYRSLEHRQNALSDAGELTQTITNRLRLYIAHGRIDSRMIQETTQVALNRFDRAASVHYAAHHN